ncbi:MAG: hypothetical protein M3N30_04710 [Bacteroidota bacterium]|nr:hypothetical protein [Bacteroidota bacterium]
MKKKILILMAAFILIFFAGYANKEGQKVPASVATEFTLDFSHASEVKWEITDTYYKASFIEHGQIMYAFYTSDGERMGIAYNILSDRLPASLLSELKVKYSDYWITDLIHLSIKNDSGFIVTLENGDQKIMLKADENKSWMFYSMSTKN